MGEAARRAATQRDTADRWGCARKRRRRGTLLEAPGRECPQRRADAGAEHWGSEEAFGVAEKQGPVLGMVTTRSPILGLPDHHAQKAQAHGSLIGHCHRYPASQHLAQEPAIAGACTAENPLFAIGGVQALKPLNNEAATTGIDAWARGQPLPVS